MSDDHKIWLMPQTYIDALLDDGTLHSWEISGLLLAAGIDPDRVASVGIKDERFRIGVNFRTEVVRTSGRGR